MRRILITGSTGQVGWELARTLMPLGELLTPTRGELDLSEPSTVARYLSHVRPDVVVNAAAYTAVDKAESEPELAHRINADSPAEMARTCATNGALLVHYSTDYVFDGRKGTAYLETDVTNPQSVYGRTKLAGEQAIQSAGGRSIVLRTSWVFAARGKNFLLTMLKLAHERDELRVVCDQVGAPTWSRFIAEATAQVIARIPGEEPPPVSLAHLTCAGQTHWHQFAYTIIEVGAQLGLCPRPRVTPIPTSDYPTPAQRPALSTLDTRVFAQAFGINLPSWQDALRRCMEELSVPRPR